jgi:(2R)-sulfolactate sulfo-lyase subunit alpha
MHKFLIHRSGDHLGVATQDIREGEAVVGVYMDDDSIVEVVAKGNIPLGHKMAIESLETGAAVIEYGQQVGITKTAIVAGDYVHVHNIKSARW